MTDIEAFLFKRLARREVTQDYCHKDKIRNMYKIIVDAARKEFNEDNKVTLDSFLNEIHCEALGIDHPY